MDTLVNRLFARKTYKGYPFAHRQHLHAGHCAHIHGHNWDFGFEFQCKELMSNGFVIDFGELKFIKEFLDDNFDHTLVLNENDPSKGHLISMLTHGPEYGGPLAKIVVVGNCSCEGIAQFVYEKLNPVVLKRTDGRVWICQIVVAENDRNQASLFT